MLTKKLLIAMMFILMLAAGGVQAGGDAARGAELSSDCADCHGDEGKGDEIRRHLPEWMQPSMPKNWLITSRVQLKVT